MNKNNEVKKGFMASLIYVGTQVLIIYGIIVGLVFLTKTLMKILGVI